MCNICDGTPEHHAEVMADRDIGPVIEILAETEVADYGEDGDSPSRLNTIILRCAGYSTKALEEEVAERWPAEHCQHEYDCCGQFYYWSANIERHGDLAIITRTASQNI